MPLNRTKEGRDAVPKLTEAKLRAWHRRAVALDAQARRLMDSMGETLGFDDESTDPIDNVLHATESLCSVLSRPTLAMWQIHMQPKPPKAGRKAVGGP
jgi:hypothetical protein